MSQTVFPILIYRDAHGAIDWLGKAFGCEPGEVHEGEDGKVQHAEVRLGGATVMLGSEGGGDPAFEDRRPGTGFVYVAADGIDALHERATAAGAEVVRELADTDYGSRDFSVRDPEGNVWSFGTYSPTD